jgi:formylglycine-generating enzyme required for sulfatase activity
MVAPSPPRAVSAAGGLVCAVALVAACAETPPPEANCPKTEPAPAKVTCPAGTEQSGNECVKTEVRTDVDCPDGSHFEDGACRATLDTRCPPATTYQQGVGCVPGVVPLRPAAGGSCPADMVLVAGGAFRLAGYQKSRGTTTVVQHFCIDKTEVTVGAYKACAKKGTCPTDKLACNPKSSTWNAHDDKLPLNCIDYTDSATYCTSVGKRLPTEDEWEWAARGASLGFAYPWGGTTEDWSKLCASTPKKRDLPCKVGSFPAGDTPLGVHDMAGSLWEWATTTRPEDNSKPTDMAIRGGGWDIVIGFASFSSESRVGYETTYRSKAVGFRCAMTPPAGAEIHPQLVLPGMESAPSVKGGGT